MKHYCSLCGVVLLFITSACVDNSIAYKSLQAQRDSLAIINENLYTEHNEIFELINAIEANLEFIRVSEQKIEAQLKANKPSNSQQQLIAQELEVMNATIETNKEKAQTLEQLCNKKTNNALYSMVARINRELDNKTKRIDYLSKTVVISNVK